MTFCKACLISLLLITVAKAGETIHVGVDHPIRDISKLKKALADRHDISEVVIHEGVYFASLRIYAKQEAPPLVIRAADGAEVVFEGSAPINNLTPITNDPAAGVWATPAVDQDISLLKIWDASTRIRYKRVADRASVMHFPATFTIEDQTLLIHTVDTEKPINLRKAAADRGIAVERSNVTVRGIQFRDYLLRDKWSTAIDLRAENGTIEDCAAQNTSLGFSVRGNNNVVRRCRTADVGGGVYVSGEETTVEECHLFKTRDRFMVPMFAQDDSGIQFYYPAKGGSIRGNLCVGFGRGIFMKCHSAPYLIEHNTIDGLGQGWGFGSTKWGDGEQFRFNIVTRCSRALEVPADVPQEALANNLYWLSPRENEKPNFVAPERQDYRLTNESPALKLKQNGRPAGAFAAIGDEPAFSIGAARVWHVSMRGNNGYDGSADKPWRTIQHAINATHPGDTVLVLPGIYDSPIAITRGGIEGYPITLRATEKWKAVIDSNKENSTAIKVTNAPYVAIVDFEIRWYGNTAARADNSPHLTLAGCRIWNNHWRGSWPGGTAAHISMSPHFHAHHNVIFAQAHGLSLVHSPASLIVNNTVVGNLFAGIELNHSANNTVVKRNILAWNGNDQLEVRDRAEALKAFDCNHNVYATQLRVNARTAGHQSLDPPSDVLSSGSKAIFALEKDKGELIRLSSLAAWQEMTGQDVDSVFMDPQFLDVEKCDFRLQPKSPARQAGAYDEMESN